jgi:hypothetical protein
VLQTTRFLKQAHKAENQTTGQKQEGKIDSPARHFGEPFEAEQPHSLSRQRLGPQAVRLHEVHDARHEGHADTDRSQHEKSHVQKLPDILAADQGPFLPNGRAARSIIEHTSQQR